MSERPTADNDAGRNLSTEELLDKLGPEVRAEYKRIQRERQSADYDAGYRDGAEAVVAGVRAWCSINEIAEPPLDWEGLGEFLTRVIPPGKDQS